MHTKLTPTDLVPLIIIVAMLALLPVACTEGLDRQAQADYEKCLSWQADGYDIKCDGGKW
ncbi:MULTISPECIES: hypothetical protein [unclassified Moraxella]|uniref:hypothetical protein n=1 Tax=unclassified Moraxella TaxID=2685852 RepID=UPI00359E382F